MRAEWKYTSNVGEIKGMMKANIFNALDAVGVFVEGEAMERCPVDTGNLKGSINHAVVSENEVQIGTNVDYGVYVEMGTYKMAAQPFLRPACESNIGRINALFKEVINL